MPDKAMSEEEIERIASQLNEQIAVLKELARERGQAFSSLGDDELVRKLRGETSNSPFIYAQAWTSGTTQGSAASYSVYVQNPDPVGHFPFYATIFFGLGNFFDIGQGWVGRDRRWPEFSSDRTFLAANTTASFTFDYAVPTGIPPGTYNGNSVLWAGDWHDVGRSFDRGSFDVDVT